MFYARVLNLIGLLTPVFVRKERKRAGFLGARAIGRKQFFFGRRDTFAIKIDSTQFNLL